MTPEELAALLRAVAQRDVLAVEVQRLRQELAALRTEES